MSDDRTPPGASPGPEPQPTWGTGYPTQPGYPIPPGYGYPPYSMPPKHPDATTAMVLGIVAVAGGVLCWLPLLISPAAWIIGAKSVREIDASQGTRGGRGEATAGKVLGMVGTGLLTLVLALVVLLVVLSLTIDNFWEEFWGEGSYDSISSAVVH